MAEQIPIFITGYGGRERQIESFDARPLHRRENPPTSVAAAKRVAVRLTHEQTYALRVLVDHGPGTAMELAERTATTAADKWVIYHRISRRYREVSERLLLLRSPLYIRVQREAYGKPVERNGRQSWEVVWEAR